MNIGIDKNIKRLSGIAAILMLAVSVIGCKHNVNTSKVAVTDVTLNKTELTLEEGKSEKLTATVLPENATNRNVTWSSDKTDIAEVNQDGTVTAKKTGTAKITVKTEDGGKTTDCTVRVTAKSPPPAVAVTGVTLSKTELTLEEDKSEKLTATVLPENATNKKITWSSDKADVAEVSQDGTVTAKKAGTAKITVKTEDGGKTADCTVTVTAKAPPPAPKPTYAITFGVEGTNGTIKAIVDGNEINSGDNVEQGTTVTFTATPLNTDYSVEKWTITGGTFEAGGIEGSLTATVQITGETAVKVSFTLYKTIAFGANLADYLNTGSPASDGIYYINVTGLQWDDLDGEDAKPSRLGKILKEKSSKKVSLKLPKTVEGLTSMRNCFLGCENLVSVAVIPESVTNMNGCFKDCTNFTEAPAIPESAEDMSACFRNCTKLTQAPPIPKNTKFMFRCFENCTSLTSVTLKCNYSDGGRFIGAFNGCTGLGVGSIKVPSSYYDNYTAPAALTAMQVPGADDDAKKAKFAKLDP